MILKKVEKALEINPWNIYFPKDNYKTFFEVMKQCIELERNTNQ